MALPKKQLKERLQNAGVSDEQIDEICKWILDGHTESVEAVKEQLETVNQNVNTLNTKIAEYETMTKERDSLKSEVEKLKASDDKAKAVQKEFDEYKAGIVKRDTDAAKRRAVTSALKSAGVQREEMVDLLIGKVDFDKVEMDGEKLKDAEAFVNPFRQQYGSLFATTTTEGAPKVEPPTGGSGGITREEILKIKDSAKRQQAIAEHIDLFS